MLLNEQHPLHNREMHISGILSSTEKANIDEMFTPKTAAHVRKLKEAFGRHTVFGRSDAQKVLGLKPTRSSELLRDMEVKGLIVPVSGQGKGKYRFL